MLFFLFWIQFSRFLPSFTILAAVTTAICT
jgi:hypothetical protein